MAIECPNPNCQRNDFGSGRAVAIHWSHEHKGSVPDSFDTSLSSAHRQKLSDSLSGEDHPMYGSDRSGENNPMYGSDRSGEDNPFYGQNHTEETKQKMSEAKKGSGNPAWNPDRLSESQREEVISRDGSKCQDCSLTREEYKEKHDGDDLNVHHIDEDRTNNQMGNLITLCKSCHAQRHSS